MFDFLFCCFYFFCPKTHYLSQHFAISFAVLIYSVYLTYCKICDKGYKDTDLASLMLAMLSMLYIRGIMAVFTMHPAFYRPHGLLYLHCTYVQI